MKRSAIQHQGGPKGDRVRARIAKYTGRGQRTYTPTFAIIERARGSTLYTADGQRLIDFASGVLVANLGHNHAGFEKRFRGYSLGLPRTSYNMATPIEADAARRIVQSMKRNRNAEKVLWAASGSEGIQKAMWAALACNAGRSILVATAGGFHGKKGLAGEVSGESSANPNVRFISFPRAGQLTPDDMRGELDALERAHRGKIALLITEPYLGAAGSYHPPKWYHPLLQEWCQKHGVIFIFDEVQSCHGRTGAMYAHEAYGVEPDLVVLGKGLGNGEPVAAVVGRTAIIDSLDYGEASDTFSGNPRACAAVCAVLDVFREEKVLAQCRRNARLLGKLLNDLPKAFPFVRDVRGEGMVYGVEMASEDVAEACVLEAYRGARKWGVHFLGPLAGKVLRVSPPLTISEAELKRAHSVLMKGWARVNWA